MSKKKLRKSLLKSNRQASLSNFLYFKSEANIYFLFNKQNAEKFKEFLKQKKEIKKAKRKKLLNIGSFVLNAVILAVMLVYSLSTNGAEGAFPKIDFRWLFGLVGLTIFIFISDSLKIYFLILSSTKKSRPFLSFKTSVLGRYYDSITPSSLGGQPFQMLYMNKHGINGGVATSIPLMKTIFWQVSNVILCTIVLAFGTLNKMGGNGVTTSIAWISLIIQFVGISSIFLLSVSKKIGPRIVIWILKLLSKMHIIKNYKQTFRNVMRFVANYQKTFRSYAKTPWLIIVQFILSFIDIFIYDMIPFMVYKTFIPNGTIPFLEIFTQSIICNLTLMFIPTPGASGGAEGSFWAIFDGAFGGNTFWPVIFWRFSTYYSTLLVGLFVLIYDFAIGNKKLERLKEAGLQKQEDNEEKSFRQVLEKDREDIRIVREQEGDKIMYQALLNKNKKKNKQDEIIKNSEIVSEQEMDEIIYPAEKVLDDMTAKRNQKKIKRNEKKEQKKRHKNKI